MVTEISREELREKLEHREHFWLIEAGSPEDYGRLHIPSAINIPPETLYTLAPQLIREKDIEVVVYCSGPTWHRAYQVANDLAGLGYYEVRYYAGGKSDWMQAGLPVAEGKQRAS